MGMLGGVVLRRFMLKMGVSLETSSKKRDVGGVVLRRFMLKMMFSLHTSSNNGDVEIGREIARLLRNGRFA